MPTLGIPSETLLLERRVAITPDAVPRLIELGFTVRVERGAGASAGYADGAYTDAGATIVDDPYDADVVVKVQPPSAAEIGRLKSGSTLISLIFPARDETLTARLAEAGVTAIALDKIPRISRAQKMDVLSSMANIAGYRAVLEASRVYEGFFAPQVTAAGTDPPAKVLVIGAGVAGLASIAAARALGAEVRAFDVRADCKEQVESLGASFLTVELEESGEGEGGYAKTMSPEFIAAEMALFAGQAAGVDVIVTTALVPGAKAPVLITDAMVAAMKPGSVVVDLAAEQGGNCEPTVPGEASLAHGVHILGYTDLASRMASTASRFFAGNVGHLLHDMVVRKGEENEFRVDLEDEVVRGATLVHEGAVLPPPERKPAPPRAAPKKTIERAIERPTKKPPPKPSRTWISGVLMLIVFGLVGAYAPAEFVQHFTVFVLSCFIGWQLVWSVTPALHTPLMSVTNAISGIILVGGLLQAGRQATGNSSMHLAAILGAVAILVASVNVFGGFYVTQRMLKMFRKGHES